MYLLRAVLLAGLLTPVGTMAADYVGSNVCKTCHPDVWAPEYTGCESCHGPGKAHVDARGGKATIVAFSQLTADKVLDACLRCHSKTLSRANIRRSTHTEQDVVCSSCHSIHKSPTPKFLLAKAQTDLCYGCHSSIRAQFSMPFKHRVNEGTVQCTDCHNPHGAFDPTWRMATRPRMVEQHEGTEEACLKCHIDKRGPFVYEHGSVRVEGCETCHSPHGSMNARLLRRPVTFTLCLECHNGQGNFGSFGPKFGNGVTRTTPDHNMADPRYRNCTGCHVRIHGSNTSEFFFR
jgi:DmsE family decaheme c-type cytochrome